MVIMILCVDGVVWRASGPEGHSVRTTMKP